VKVNSTVNTSPSITPNDAGDDMMAVTVIIPVYNEERSLPLVLSDIPQVGRVIVVDNASSDNSPTVAKGLGADVVHEPRRGYGSACLSGIAEIERRIASGAPAPQIVVFLDGDYSDYPEQLHEIVAPLFRNDFDLVLGSRLMGERERGAMPPQSVYGNKLACFLMWLFWNAKYTDLGPFRGITWTALQQLDMQDRNFGWTVEMQIKASVQRLRVLEVPVRYRCRVGLSKISGTVSGTVRAGWKILYTIARYRWSTLWAR
jgi:glycosyltransferase involved in cell wall biosynthesis